MTWLENMGKDLRYSARSFARNPGFVIVAIITLGLGIGANSAIFSVVDSVLLRRLPFREPARLVTVWLSRRAHAGTEVTSYPNYLDWQRAPAFAGLAAFSPLGVNVTGMGEAEPERLPAATVSADFFPVLGADPALGRTFLSREERAGEDGVVILSDGLWRRRFGADPGVLGRTLRARGRTVSVVGVMPPGFDFPDGAQLWLPLAPLKEQREDRGILWLRTVGRLRPGVSPERAQAEMDAVGARLARQYPDALADYGVAVRPVREYLVGNVRPAILVLLGAVAFVLLIACANIANLLLARSAAREQEIAVRSAIGASRGRIVRQLLTESVVLGVLGGAAGLLLAVWGVRFLRSATQASLRNAAAIGIDGRVLAFTLAVSLVTGVLFGLAPALQASRPRFGEALKERATGGSRRRRLTLKALVVSEVGLALMLLIISGLLLQSFARLQRTDPGFQPARVLTVSIALTGSDYPTPARTVAFYQELLERVRALPGVSSAGASSAVLLPEVTSAGAISVDGHPNPTPRQRALVTEDAVTPGFFRSLGTPLVRGRALTAEDGTGKAEVALINATMARRFWPGEDPVGKRFKFGTPDDPDPWITVAGVVADARRSSLEREEPPSCFRPYQHLAPGNMTLVVRSAGDPRRLAPAVVRAIHAIDPNQPVTRVATLEELMGERLSLRRFSALLLALFSLLALGLAAIGIYGVISYTVSQSLHDIGIRMALGAGSGDVLRLVLGNGLRMILLGIALGLGGAVAAGRALSSLLFGVTATDPATFAGLSLLLVLLSCAATYLPARRAARTDPLLALRAG